MTLETGWNAVEHTMETSLMSRERMLPLDDFIRSTEPAYKESRLLPFWEEIRIARARKYTLAQIRQWLNQNGIDISIQGLSRFIIVQTARDNGLHPAEAIEAWRPEVSRPKPTSENISAPAAQRRDRREQTAAQFIRDDANSVLNILKDQSK
jgi:DNA-binding transcriptional MerR regulator